MPVLCICFIYTSLTYTLKPPPPPLKRKRSQSPACARHVLSEISTNAIRNNDDLAARQLQSELACASHVLTTDEHNHVGTPSKKVSNRAHVLCIC